MSVRVGVDLRLKLIREGIIMQNVINEYLELAKIGWFQSCNKPALFPLLSNYSLDLKCALDLSSVGERC